MKLQTQALIQYVAHHPIYTFAISAFPLVMRLAKYRFYGTNLCKWIINRAIKCTTWKLETCNHFYPLFSCGWSETFSDFCHFRTCALCICISVSQRNVIYNLYKITGLFCLRYQTPPRPLALEGWNLDMLLDMVWGMHISEISSIGPSIGAIY